MVRPRPLFMRQRKQAIDSTTKTSIINNMVMEQTMPTEFTSTGASQIIPQSSQGIGKLHYQTQQLVSSYLIIIVHAIFCIFRIFLESQLTPQLHRICCCPPNWIQPCRRIPCVPQSPRLSDREWMCLLPGRLGPSPQKIIEEL